MKAIVPRSLFWVELPLPPSTNHLFATAGKKRVKSREYRMWLATAVPLLLQLRKPVGFPSRVKVVVFGKVNAGRDLDNMLKPIGDALVAAGVLPGDSVKYVSRWEIEYEPDDAPEPVATVSVAALETRP